MNSTLCSPKWQPWKKSTLNSCQAHFRHDVDRVCCIVGTRSTVHTRQSIHCEFYSSKETKPFIPRDDHSRFEVSACNVHNQGTYKSNVSLHAVALAASPVQQERHCERAKPASSSSLCTAACHFWPEDCLTISGIWLPRLQHASTTRT